MDTHKLCQPLSSENDPVCIAASLEDSEGLVWWMTYRQQIIYPEKELGIEISRIKPSRSSGMLGSVIENVPRFKMHFEDGGKVLRFIEFNFEDDLLRVCNPRRIYDYTEPE